MIGDWMYDSVLADLEHERETVIRILNLCEREKRCDLARKIEALVEKRDESGQSDEEYLAKESDGDRM